MRVLEIMGSLHRGGAETMIMNYYRAFDKQLCQMDFVVHARFDNDYCQEAEQMGAKIIELHRPGQIGPFRYIKELSDAVKRYGPYDAVHIHTNYQAFLSIIAAYFAGIRKIFVHSHTAKYSGTWIYINRYVMKVFGVKRLACGRAAGNAFFGREPYIIINNAIDIKKYKEIDNKNYTKIKHETFGKQYVLGHLGRFVEAKNHSFMLNVMERLVQIRKDIVLALYGDGEDRTKIEELAKAKGLENYVQFMGVTNDVITAYRTMDLFLLPSLYEGFPVTLVEFQLSGISGLVSDCVSDECDLQAGLVTYLPLKEDRWVAKILEKIENRQYAVKHVASDVLNQFDVKVQWKRLYEIYMS